MKQTQGMFLRQVIKFVCALVKMTEAVTILRKVFRNGTTVLCYSLCSTYNERSLYFQLIETTCYLIGFHGNHSNMMTSQVAAILDFQNAFFIYKFKHTSCVSYYDDLIN